jgi:CheY-like chemotaxis protein/PAS domain-containing protein
MLFFYKFFYIYSVYYFIMIKLYNLIRQNGCRHLYNKVAIRQVVYLNLIWLFSYLTIVFNNIAALFIYQSYYSFIILSSLTAQLLLWVVFLLVRHNKSVIARPLFLLTIYATATWFSFFYGKFSYTSLFYFAFLPSAFNIYSLKKNRLSVIVFILMPLVLVLFSELYEFKNFSAYQWADAVINKMRITNICISFMLFLLYAGYIILNSVNKQNKLITQSTSLQTTLDNAVGAIWSVDKDYNLLTVNKSFAEFIKNEYGFTGIKADLNVREFIAAPNVAVYFQSYYTRVLNGESLFENFSFREKVYELKATPILDEKNNAIIGATFTSRDVTSRVAAEQLLVQAKLKAEEASFAKERFLSNMSHELRTPLNGIVGVTNIMLDEKYLPEQEKHFETLKNLSEHTLGVVNNILDLSKIDAEKAQLSSNRFNLILFVKKLRSIFENTAKLKKIDFAIEVIGDADIFLMGDEIKLSQVLINLIGNSIKFTEKGFTKLIITIDDNIENGELYKLRFSVTDSGIGIHKKHQEKIFESFTQADANTTRRFGGSGLGITISDRILQMMQAKLYVESELGKGSTFWFDLELKKSSFVPKNKIMLKGTGTYFLPGTNILLAEDNKINQMVAKRFLEKWKATVTVVDNGKAALDTATSSKYDIILMDLDMPVMDGYQATTLIKETHPNLPIIALTAASFDDMQEYLIKKGFTDVVQKPFMPDELYKKISAVLSIA